MKPLVSATHLRKLLERGIANGWWTVDDLNTPSPGWEYTNRINPKPECKHLRLPPRQWTNPLTGEVFGVPEQTEKRPYEF